MVRLSIKSGFSPPSDFTLVPGRHSIIANLTALFLFPIGAVDQPILSPAMQLDPMNQPVSTVLEGAGSGMPGTWALGPERYFDIF